MTFPTFLKNKKIIGGAAILVALIVSFFFYRGYHQKPSSKSLPVAQAPATTPSPAASVPTPEPVKVDKPSPFGPPLGPTTTPSAETITKNSEKTAEKPEAKLSPPPKMATSKLKASPPVVVKRQVVVTRQQFDDFKELLQKLVDQGITVHLINETPSPKAGAESLAPAEEERLVSDQERAEAFKEAVRKGRLP